MHVYVFLVRVCVHVQAPVVGLYAWTLSSTEDVIACVTSSADVCAHVHVQSRAASEKCASAVKHWLCTYDAVAHVGIQCFPLHNAGCCTGQRMTQTPTPWCQKRAWKCCA